MTLTEELATIIGGFAALAGLIYAMLGNPNMLRAFRKRRDTPPSTHPPQRRILDINESQLKNAVAEFAAENSVSYDLVVGVQPDGIVLARYVANRLHVRCAIMDKYELAPRSPWFVFNPNKPSRSLRPSEMQFTLPTGIANPSRILVVDMVTTFGNGLLKAEEAILKSCANARIVFYVYAVDEDRLAAQNPEVLDRLKYHIKIDNFKIWLRFPWETREQ